MCNVLVAWRSFAGGLYLWSTKRQKTEMESTWQKRKLVIVIGSGNTDL